MKGQDSDKEENIAFTEKEKAALKEASLKVKMDILNNAAVLSWDGSNGQVKLTISKIPQPQQRTSVYSAESEIDGELDKDRTINSRSFKTEDDVAILKEFLAKLKLNEEVEELDEAKKQIWGKPVKRIHYVNKYPVRDEKTIRSEVIGNIRHVYKLAGDIKVQKAGEVKGRKKKTKSSKKHHKHQTKVKLVSAYPIVDGKPVHSQTIGNITYRYKTKQDKKEEAEKRKAERKRKPKKKVYKEENEITLVSADENGAIVQMDGKEQKIKRYQTITTPSGNWTYTEYLSPEETDENEAGIMITKVGEPTAPTKIENLIVGQTIKL